MPTQTARCPICHRRANVEHGRMASHKSGERECSGTGCFYPSRKASEIAESVVRDLRRQDDERGGEDRASEALEKWRVAAKTTGDSVVTAALKLLHPDTAIALYALPGVRGGARDVAESRTLLKAAGLQARERSTLPG